MSKAATGGVRAKGRGAGRPSLSSAPALGEEILAAASRVFVAKGFAGATMRQIAEEARVSPQTLYARFADKALLFEALMEQRTTALLGAMTVSFRADAAPREALEAFGVTLLSTFLSTDLQQLHQMVIGEAKTFPALAQTFYAAGPDRGRSLLIASLQRWVSAGELQIGQVEVAAEQFIGSLVGSIVIRSTLAQPPRVFDEAQIRNWVGVAVQGFLRAYGPG